MNDNYNILTNKIKSVYTKQTRIDFLTSLLNSVSTILILFLLFSFLEYFLNGDSTTRKFFYYSFLSLAISSILFSFKNQILKLVNTNYQYSLANYAFKIGDHFPDIKDKLLNVIQLVPIDDGKSDLTNFAFNKLFENVNHKNFDEVIEKRKLKRSLIYFSSTLLLFIISFVSLGSKLSSASSRIINYEKSYLPPAPFNLFFKSNKIEIIRGEDVLIEVLGKGKLPNEINLLIKEDGQKTFESLTLRKEKNKYIYKISSIKSNMSIYGSAPYYQSEVQTNILNIIVTDLPFIKKFDGIVSLPSYTKQASFKVNDNNGDITTLKGSLFSFEIVSNKIIKEANLVFKNSILNDSSIVKNKLKVDGNSAQGSYNIKSTGEYYFEIIDESGIKNNNPIIYKIVALEDRLPEISLISPKEDITLNENAILPLITQISDDYGFNKLKLNYRLSASPYNQPEEKFSNVEISIPSSDLIQEIPYVWDLNKLGVVPEMEYEFYLEIFDNDIVSGPKSSRTAIMKLRLPSMEEVFNQSQETQKEAIKDISEVIKETEKLKEDIEKLQNDLSKENNQKVDWEKQNKAKSISDKQKDLREKYNEIQNKLEESTEKMQENNILSKETLDKLKELQELMRDVATDEMKEKARKFQDEITKMSKDEMKKALDEMKLSDEEFRKRIERSMELLKNLQMEQKMDQLSKKAKEMEKSLDKVSKELNNNKNSQEESIKKQEEVKKDVNQLEQELAKLGEEIKNKDDKSMMEEFQKALEKLDPKTTKEQLNQANENIQQNKNQQAQRNQENAKDNLNKFAQQMQKMKQNMQQKASEKVMNQMQKSTSDLLKLSKEQESLRKQMQKLDYNSTQLPNIQKKQAEIKQALDNIAKQMDDLAKESIEIPQNITKAMSQAMKEMSKSEQELSERRTNTAASAQQNAMAALNESANSMKSAMNGMKGDKPGDSSNPGGAGQGEGSGRGTGQGATPSFSQQLQQAAAQQQQIQDAMQKMQNQGGANGGKDGQNQNESKDGQSGDKGEGKNKTGMQGRLDNQMGEAQKKIEELKEEQKKFKGENAEKIANELKKVSEEMKEIMADVSSGKITDKTLERQQRILSRLLDAYKSVNERDFSKKRESNTGKNKQLVSPDELKFNDFEKKKAMEEMMKKMKLGYSKDYETIIKSYFEEINKNE